MAKVKTGAPGTTARQAFAGGELDQLVMPPVPSLSHDATWFASVERARPHAAMLRHLRRRWRWRWER